MKRRAFLSMFAGALASVAAPVALSIPSSDERTSWRTCVRMVGESPAPRAGDWVTFREPFPGAYIVPGDHGMTVGSLLMHQEDGRWYACDVVERCGDCVRAEILPASWA